MLLMRTLFAALALAGCASSPGTAPPPEPHRVAINDARLRALATNAARGTACRSLAGKYIPVRDESTRVVVGRWHIDHCDASDAPEPFAFGLTLHGRGWRHVDRLESGVHVLDYVRFDGAISATEIVDVAPDDGRHLAALFTPRNTTSAFRLLRAPQYETTTLTASTLDLFGLVNGEVNDRAAANGAAILLARATEARSVSFDTCTGQVSTSDAYAQAAPLDGLTIEADRVRIERAAAIDIAGPFAARDQPLRFDVYVESGGRVAAAIVCANDATTTTNEWIDNDRAPSGPQGGLLSPGVRYPVTSRGDACSLALITRAIDGPATLQYRISVARADARCMGQPAR